MSEPTWTCAACRRPHTGEPCERVSEEDPRPVCRMCVEWAAQDGVRYAVELTDLRARCEGLETTPDALRQAAARYRAATRARFSLHSDSPRLTQALIEESQAAAALALADSRSLLADAEARLLLANEERPCRSCNPDEPAASCPECRGEGTVTEPVLNGRNEAQRAAQLRQLTVDERGSVALWDVRVTEGRAELAALQAESSCLRAVARLLGAEHPIEFVA